MFRRKDCMELKVTQLTKIYSSKITALDNVTFSLSPGVHGLLGPNGAGKSTLLQILTCNLKPTSGDVLWDGTSIFAKREEYCRFLGYMPQKQAMYPGFTPIEYLRYFACLREMDPQSARKRISEILDRVELSFAAEQKISTFSGGMRQRLLLAQAVLAEPKILFLDEPTAGLDPHQRIALRNLIAELASDCIVVLATHIVSDVEVVARDILLLHGGKLLSFDTTGKLCEAIRGNVWEIELSSPHPPAELVVSSLRQRIDGTYVARILSSTKPVNCAAQSVEPTLEDVFLYETGAFE